MRYLTFPLLLVVVGGTIALAATKEQGPSYGGSVPISYFGSSSVALQVTDSVLARMLMAELTHSIGSRIVATGPAPHPTPFFITMKIAYDDRIQAIHIDRMCNIAWIEEKGTYRVDKNKSPLLWALVQVLDKGRPAR